MTRLTRRSLLLASLGPVVGACAQRREESLTAFDGFVDDVARAIIADSPELATRLGLPASLAPPRAALLLDDRSALALEQRRNRALRWRIELAQFDRANLDATDQVTFDILNAHFEAIAGGARFNFGRLDAATSSFSPYSLNPLDAAFVTLPDFFDTHVPAATLDQARAYVTRLKLVADSIDAEKDRAEAESVAGIVPPDFILDRMIASAERLYATAPAQQPYVGALKRKLEALTGPLEIMSPTPANAKTPPTPPPAPSPAPHKDAARARVLIAEAESIVAAKIQPALARTIYALKAMRARAKPEAGVWRLQDDATYYAAALRSQTTTSLTPEQIHAKGAERIAAIERELDGLLRTQSLTEGSIGERLAILTRDPRVLYEDSDVGRSQILDAVHARVKRMLDLAPQFFATMPKAKLDVRRVPLLQEGASSGAYYQGPSLDGAQPGIYFVNLRSVADMTKIDLPTQDFHEAVPGHHFQVALAQENKTLPLYRRITSTNAYGEGWALYAEQLADEMGMHEGDALGRIGYLRWQMWRAARLVVDTGLHALQWTRAQAIEYLLKITGDTYDVVTSEVDRYCVWPGQACGYEIGRAEIVRLREKARRALGAAFNIRNFHAVILGNGDVPLPVLETLVDQWIARVKSGKK